VPEPDVTWLFNGKPLTTSGNVIIKTDSDMHMYSTTVKIKKTRRDQEGSYSIIAKNREGDASMTLTLKVIERSAVVDSTSQESLNQFTFDLFINLH